MARAGLRIVSGPSSGRTFDVEGAMELGRGIAGSPELSDPTISRRHARLSIDSSSRLTIEDLGSQNGTLVNGRVITGLETLIVGDVVDIGDTTLVVISIEPSVVLPAPVAAAEDPAEAARRVTRSRSIAAGLPVISARTLIRAMRVRGAIAALAVTAVLWLVFYLQLKAGDDPGLSKTAATVKPAAPGSGTPSPTGTSISQTPTPTTTKAS